MRFKQAEHNLYTNSSFVVGGLTVYQTTSGVIKGKYGNRN